MKIFHTSPVEIKEINKRGIAGECLFFSSDIYTMTAYRGVYVYSIEVDEDAIVRARQLHDDQIIEDVALYFECDEDMAERILDGRRSEWSMESCTGDMSWWLQGKRGECARKMGYLACEDEDEQGTVYIVPMAGKESDLTLQEVRKS